MGKITINFAEVQSRTVIPADNYAAVIADVVLKEKAGSEHPYFSWEIAIAEGEYEGRKPQAMATSMKPEALWKLQETLQNLGFEATEENFDVEWDDTTGQMTSPEVIGLPCTIVVYNEMYNNRMTSKISNILGPNGEDVSGQSQAVEAAAKAPATRPATKSSPVPAAAASKNGPAKRTPFPASKAGARSFK